MRSGNFFLVCLMVFLAMFFSVTSSADEQGRKAELIKAAAISEMCLHEYWADEVLYRRDPLTMRVVIDGDKFYSKVEDVYFFHGRPTTLYHIGLLKPDKAVVTHNFERDMKRRFEEGPVITETLIFPFDCAPKYDPSTPRKELMMRTVASTIQKFLNSLVELGIAEYPHEVGLVIADFNVDYQSTDVLVEQTNKVYRITLHDPDDYDSDEYERDGDYPLGEQYNPAKSLIKKLRKHGIRKKITIDAPADKGGAAAR